MLQLIIEFPSPDRPCASHPKHFVNDLYCPEMTFVGGIIYSHTIYLLPNYNLKEK